MGWRFRKRTKIAPGVNLNLSHRGVGISAGSKLGRISLSPTGRITGTQTIPGTGLYHQQTLHSPKQTAQKRTVTTTPAPFLVRLLYFILIGWWATALWWTLALALMCTLIGIPLALRMLRATGTVLTLA